MVMNSILFLYHLLKSLFFLGVGSVGANEGDSDDGDNGPGEITWAQLLNKDEDGVYSLKPWNEVRNAVKEDLAKAMREYIRQAWSK